MKQYDNYELWAGYTFRQEEGLIEAEIKYWSQFHRWPLVMAVYLSMGQIPYKKPIGGKLLESMKRPTDPAKLSQLEDFESRLNKAKKAAVTGELVIEKIPDMRGLGHPYVERLVPIRNFIEWAYNNYETNYDKLFKHVLESYQSPEHTAAGKQGAIAKRRLLDRIKEYADIELDGRCLCQHNELADYLRDLMRGDGKHAILEARKSREGKQPEIELFREAVTECFKERGLPRSHEKKGPGQERGRKMCGRHCDRT